MILALDLSSNTGWALLDKDKNILKYGNIKMTRATVRDFGVFPVSYVLAAQDVASQCAALVKQYNLDQIVIEETNHGRASGYSQKFLEYVHCLLLQGLMGLIQPDQIKYVATGDWRKTLGIKLSKEERVNNIKVNKANRSATTAKEKNAAKAAVGVTSKVTTKHLSVAWVNQQHGTSFVLKDADVTDAICIGTAYLVGARVSQGK